MAHELAGALQQACRIRQSCAVKEPHVYVRSEYVDVAEGRVSQTCNRVAVMQKLSDFVPAFSHHLKPLMRDGSQFTCMLFHPRIDGRIPLNCAVESQQFRSHRRSSAFGINGYVVRLPSLQQNLPRPHASCGNLCQASTPRSSKTWSLELFGQSREIIRIAIPLSGPLS